MPSPQTLLMLPVLFFSVMCHEVAHAWVAYRGGDDTAKLAGRITMNPLAHVDPIGSVLIPLILLFSQAGFLFGWAKPVPVNPLRLRSRKWDLAVSLAGVTVNLILAILATAAFKVFLLTAGRGPLQELSIPWCIEQIIWSFIIINLVLMVFNLLPIPPLDGSHVLFYFVGTRDSTLYRLYATLERFGFILLLILLSTGTLSYILHPALKILLKALFFVFQIE